MSNQNQDTEDAEDSETEEAEEEEFELEGPMSRGEGVEVLRRFANGVENGSVDLGRDEGPVNVPDDFEVEVEYEETEGEAELEVELEWSVDE